MFSRPLSVALVASGLFLAAPGCLMSGGEEVAVTEVGFTSPLPGSTCTTTNEIASRACGNCGEQEAICLPSHTWSGWSPCAGEPVDACTPGTVEEGDACGNCGTKQRTCSATCRWSATTCSDQGCAPGSIDFTSAGCTTGYRRRDCNATCGYGPFGGCEDARTLSLANVGDTDSTVVNLDPNRTLPRLVNPCPNARLSSTRTAFKYVRIDNTGAAPILVTVKTRSKTGKKLDTILAAYPGTREPTTDAERAACLVGVSDSAPAGSPALQDATLTGASAVRIEAHASVMIYAAAYDTSNGRGALEVEAVVDSVL